MNQLRPPVYLGDIKRLRAAQNPHHSFRIRVCISTMTWAPLLLTLFTSYTGEAALTWGWRVPTSSAPGPTLLHSDRDPALTPLCHPHSVCGAGRADSANLSDQVPGTDSDPHLHRKQQQCWQSGSSLAAATPRRSSQTPDLQE